nr:Receptor-type guanylate cyclase gcy-13 [Polyrhizophydium stewartii]
MSQPIINILPDAQDGSLGLHDVEDDVESGFLSLSKTTTLKARPESADASGVTFQTIESGSSAQKKKDMSIYDAMRMECEEMEFNLMKARDQILQKEDVAFLMQRNDEEITKLQIQQAKELKEKADMFDKSTKARAERKAAKKLHRSNMRRIKYRDMLIQKQETIERAAQLLRQGVLDQSEAFETLMSHVRSVHEQQRVELMAAQERKLEYERAINDLEINSKPDEIRLGLAKKFQVRQSHQRILNKRLNEHLRDRQIVEARHVKEKFELESRCADEMGTLRVSHVTRIAEQQESQFLELNNEKERLQAEHEARKLAALAQRHQAELKRLQQVQRLAIKQLRSMHDQKIAMFKEDRSAGATGISAMAGIMSGISSTTDSLNQSAADINDTVSERGSQILGSPPRPSVGHSSPRPARLSPLGQRNFGPSDESEMLSQTSDYRDRRAMAIQQMQERHHQERASLLLTVRAEMAEIRQQNAACIADMAEDHRVELEKLEMEQREELELIRAMLEKEILVEQSVHESEMAALVERRVLNSVLESVVDGIINIRPDGVVTRFNRAAERIFGYSAKEVVGNNIKMLMPKSIARRHDEFLMTYLKKGVKKVIGSSRRTEGKRKNGEIFPMKLSLSEVKEQDEHLFTGIICDLTEQVWRETQIRENEIQEQRKLEQLVSELELSRAETEELLCEEFPRGVAKQLMDGKQVTPQSFECATVLYLGVVDFSDMCETMDPSDIVSLLDEIYSTLDDVIQKYDACRLKAAGDSYLIVSGIPTPNGDRHASEIATLALEIMSKVHLFQFERNPSLKLRVRIGLNTGPDVAGVVGTKMPRYCLFGDTVNTGSRMESTSQPMRIQISESTYAMLKAAGGFQIVERGEIDVKASCVLRAVLGKGKMRTYFLNGKENFPYELPPQ